MMNPYDDTYVFTDDDVRSMLQQELKQYEETHRDITPVERRQLRKWVSSGNSVNDNPSAICGEDGCHMDFITACRFDYERSLDFFNRLNLKHSTDLTTRRRRRAAVNRIMSELTNIRNAEQRCLDNTPENFQGNESFELGEIAVETLDEILELLNQVY